MSVFHAVVTLAFALPAYTDREAIMQKAQEGANVEMVKGRVGAAGHLEVFLRAKKDIKAGTALSLAYGKVYWQSVLGINDDAPSQKASAPPELSRYTLVERGEAIEKLMTNKAAFGKCDSKDWVRYHFTNSLSGSSRNRWALWIRYTSGQWEKMPDYDHEDWDQVKVVKWQKGSQITASKEENSTSTRVPKSKIETTVAPTSNITLYGQDNDDSNLAPTAIPMLLLPSNYMSEHVFNTNQDSREMVRWCIGADAVKVHESGKRAGAAEPPNNNKSSKKARKAK